jgi:acyl-CoA synthetase (AMP-forming)/AMP-acid ligase II
METISETVLRIPGTGEGTFDGESFATMLGHWARHLGDEVALTYLDHRAAVDGRAVTLSWRELDERVSAVAARLREIAVPGDRAAVLASQSADYVVAFLGAIRAGLVAVPLFAPHLPGHEGRLAAALEDCTPRVALTTAEGARSFLSTVWSR